MTHAIQSLQSEIATARRRLRRAVWALVLFAVWLLASWIGPKIHPVGNLDLASGAAILAGYSLFTALTFAWLGRTALAFLGSVRRPRERGPSGWIGVGAMGVAAGSLIAAGTEALSPAEGALGLATGAALVSFSEALHVLGQLQRLHNERESVPPAAAPVPATK